MHRFRQVLGCKPSVLVSKRAPRGALFRAVLGSAIELLQVFRLAKHHHLALGPDVLEGAGAGAVKHTQQVAQAKGRGREPDQGLGDDANVAAVQVLDAQARPHADGLAGADPEPGVETADDEGQPGAVEGLVSSQAASLPSGTCAMPVASRWATPCR